MTDPNEALLVVSPEVGMLELVILFLCESSKEKN